jgi:hypothetical protein
MGAAACALSHTSRGFSGCSYVYTTMSSEECPGGAPVQTSQYLPMTSLIGADVATKRSPYSNIESKCLNPTSTHEGVCCTRTPWRVFAC